MSMPRPILTTLLVLLSVHLTAQDVITDWPDAIDTYAPAVGPPAPAAAFQRWTPVRDLTSAGFSVERILTDRAGIPLTEGVRIAVTEDPDNRPDLFLVTGDLDWRTVRTSCDLLNALASIGNARWVDGAPAGSDCSSALSDGVARSFVLPGIRDWRFEVRFDVLSRTVRDADGQKIRKGTAVLSELAIRPHGPALGRLENDLLTYLTDQMEVYLTAGRPGKEADMLYMAERAMDRSGATIDLAAINRDLEEAYAVYDRERSRIQRSGLRLLGDWPLAEADYVAFYADMGTCTQGDCRNGLGRMTLDHGVFSGTFSRGRAIDGLFTTSDGALEVVVYEDMDPVRVLVRETGGGLHWTVRFEDDGAQLLLTAEQGDESLRMEGRTADLLGATMLDGTVRRTRETEGFTSSATAYFDGGALDINGVVRYDLLADDVEDIRIIWNGPVGQRMSNFDDPRGTGMVTVDSDWAEPILFETTVPQGASLLDALLVDPRYAEAIDAHNAQRP